MEKLVDIVKEVKEFALDYLISNLPADLTFHNVNHTLEVVHAAIEIGMQYNLSNEQKSVIEIAAWFHDCGYCLMYTGHENASKEIAEAFLVKHQYPNNLLVQVLDCIEATRYPQKPISLEAKIVSDADLYHFTKPNYHDYESALRSEHEKYLGKEYSDPEWAGNNCDMLEHHNYFTDYGKEVLQRFKAINIDRMRCRC